MITAEELRATLDYDRETGSFKWKRRTSNRMRVGDIAGSMMPHGYIKIRVCGESHYAQRLAWLYITGEWPQGEMDHKDGNRSNNTFVNLRDSAHRQNCINRPAKGASQQKNGRWRAQLGINSKQLYLGTFASENEAHSAYMRAVEEHHGEEWMCRKRLASQ